MRVAAYLLSVSLMLFGFSCLNYTKAFGVEHHYEFATETGLPGPSGTIYWLGILTLAGSSICLGFLLGSRRRRKPD